MAKKKLIPTRHARADGTRGRRIAKKARQLPHIPTDIRRKIAEYMAIDDLPLYMAFTGQPGPDRTDTRSWWHTGAIRAMAVLGDGTMHGLQVPDGTGPPRFVETTRQCLRPIVRLVYNREDIRLRDLARNYEFQAATKRRDPLAVVLKCQEWNQETHLGTSRNTELDLVNQGELVDVIVRTNAQVSIMAEAKDCMTHTVYFEIMGYLDGVTFIETIDDNGNEVVRERYEFTVGHPLPWKNMEERGPPNGHLHTQDGTFVVPLSWRICIVPNWGTKHEGLLTTEQKMVLPKVVFDPLKPIILGNISVRPGSAASRLANGRVLMSWDEWDEETSLVQDPFVRLYYHMGIEHAIDPRPSFGKHIRSHGNLVLTLPFRHDASPYLLDVHYELKHITQRAKQAGIMYDTGAFSFMYPDRLYI